MNKYLIRFNKSRGQEGRGSMDHVWRVFENNAHEYLATQVKIEVPSWSEVSDGPDWNIACKGFLHLDHDTGTVTIHNKEEIMPVRKCGECTKCCEGVLQGRVFGKTFGGEVPCFFLGDKECSIYEDRPTAPCKNFKCEWLAGNYLPVWMRPDLSGALVKPAGANAEDGISVLEVGDIKPSTTKWLLDWAEQTGVKMQYQINGIWHTANNKNV